MSPDLVLRTLLAISLVGLSQTATKTQASSPNSVESPVLLEATNVLHGVGPTIMKTLLLRLREDGSLEWERNKWDHTARAYKPEKHVIKLQREDLSSIRQRLNIIDQSSFGEKMGPYATYVDTFVELKIHLVRNKQAKDFVLENPWPSEIKIGSEKPMPEPVQGLLCEIAQLRTQVSGETLPAVCKDEPSHSK